MASLILGAGGTPQGIIPHMKQMAATLGITDRFMYFVFDVDQDLENHEELLPEERFQLQMADREDLRQHAQALHLSLDLLEYVHSIGICIFPFPEVPMTQ
jgi:shikimate 5-dehydrogenase